MKCQCLSISLFFLAVDLNVSTIVFDKDTKDALQANISWRSVDIGGELKSHTICQLLPNNPFFPYPSLIYVISQTENLM